MTPGRSPILPNTDGKMNKKFFSPTQRQQEFGGFKPSWSTVDGVGI